MIYKRINRTLFHYYLCKIFRLSQSGSQQPYWPIWKKRLWIRRLWKLN